MNARGRSDSRPMRILIVVEGSEGDIRPALAVGSALLRQGHFVTACVNEDFVDRFSSCGIETVAMGASGSGFFLRYGESFYGRNLRFYAITLSLFRETLDRQFEVIARRSGEADLILASGFVFGAQSIAELRRLPLIHAVYAPVFFPSEATPPPGFRFVGMPGLLNRAAWSAYVAALDRAMIPLLNARRVGVGLPGLHSVRDHLVANLMLAMDPELAPLPPRYAARGFAQTAYPYYDDGSKIDAAILDFIRDGEAPVYIGFGSNLEAGAGRTLDIVLEAVRHAGLRALINAGIAGGGRPALPSRRTLLVGQVPHRKLFPLLAGVVHHGGAGTTHTAAYAGTPQAAVVHFIDQFYLAKRAFGLGLGPKPLPYRKLSVGTLSELLLAVTRTPGYLRNAQSLCEKLRTRDGTAGLTQLVLDRAKCPN